MDISTTNTIISGIFLLLSTYIATRRAPTDKKDGQVDDNAGKHSTIHKAPRWIYVLSFPIIIVSAIAIGYFIHQTIPSLGQSTTIVDNFTGWQFSQRDTSSNVVAFAQAVLTSEHSVAGHETYKAELNLNVNGTNGFFLSWNAAIAHSLKTQSVKGSIYWPVVNGDDPSLTLIEICFDIPIDENKLIPCKQLSYVPNQWISFDIPLSSLSTTLDYSQYKLRSVYFQGTLDPNTNLSKTIKAYIEDVQISQIKD